MLVASPAARSAAPAKPGALRPWDAAYALADALQAGLTGRDRWFILGRDPLPPPLAAVGAACPPRLLCPSRRSSKLLAEAWTEVMQPMLRGAAPPDVGAARVLRIWEDGCRAANGIVAPALADAWQAHPAPLLLFGTELLTCAAAVRALLPTARIGQFCPGPFPGTEALRALPHVVVTDILHSLLACDVVGFPTNRDLTAFGQLCSRLTGSRVQDDRVTWAGRTVRLGVFPMPAERLDDDAGTLPDRAPFPESERVIVWAGPADGTANPLTALRAFVLLLERHPSMLRQVRLLMAVGPGGSGWVDCRAALVDAAGAANARFADGDWVPVALDFTDGGARRAAALARADVVLVTGPPDQPHTLVEAAARLGRRDPAYVLAATSGAFERFGDLAVPFDSRKPASGADALRDALALEPDERARRFRVAARRVDAWAPEPWVDAQVALLTMCGAAAPATTVDEAVRRLLTPTAGGP